MIIKVCGMRDPENIRRVAALKPSYMGFIFYPHSKRYISEPDLHLLHHLDPGIRKTGVFVNEPLENIVARVLSCRLDAVQLHGDEGPDFLAKLRSFFESRPELKVPEIIKAFGVSGDFDFGLLSGFAGLADKFLFDTKTEGFGGSGQSFDWKILSDYTGSTGYLLSGGISLENLSQIQLIKDTRLLGVDLNSRFESAPGYKDIKKLEAAFQLLNPEN